MKRDTIERLRAARARTKRRGASLVKAMLDSPMTPQRRALLRAASAKGAVARREQGDATFAALLELAASGATVAEAAEAVGLSESGVRMSLRRRLGSGAWPPKEA